MAASDYHIAAKLRDAIETAVEHKIRSINPPPRIGRVQRIDRQNNICWIVFPGDANPLRVKTTYGNQPQVADYDLTDGSTNGDIVRVQGRTGNYYISEILTSASYHTAYEAKFTVTDTRLSSLEGSIPIVTAPVAPVLNVTGMPRGIMLQVVNAQPSWTYTIQITDLTTDDTPDVTQTYPTTQRPIFYTEDMPDGTSLSTASTGYYFVVTATNAMGSASTTSPVQALVLEDSNTIAELAVGKITAGDLVGAFALLGALNVGANIEITPESGIVIHTPLGDTILPANGETPQFTGSAYFNALTVLGNLSIRGTTNEIGKGGNLQLSSATTPPKAAPIMTPFNPIYATHEGYYPRGWAYHSSRNRYLFCESLSDCIITSTIKNATNGNYEFAWESFSCGSAATGGDPGGGRSEIRSGLGGIAVSGDTAYTLCTTNEGVPGTYNARWYVYKWQLIAGSANNWTYVTRWLYEPRSDLGGNAPNNEPHICITPSGELWIAQSAVSTGYVWIHKYSNTGTILNVGGNRLFQADGTTLFGAPNRDVRGLSVTNADLGAGTANERLYVVFDNGGTVFSWETDPADVFIRKTNEEFPLVHSDPRAILWDPVDLQFKTRDGPNAYLYSGIKQPKLSAVQTWRLADAVAPDYAAGETMKSPASITSTFPKRAYLQLKSGSAIPDDIGDPGDPDSVSFYVAQNDTTGSNTSFKLQTVPAAGVIVITLSTLSSTGQNPPTATFGFTAGTPATVSSATSDTDGPIAIMRGDGSGRMGPWKWDNTGAVVKQPDPKIAWFQSSSAASVANTTFQLVTGWSDYSSAYTTHAFCTIPGGSGSPSGTSTILVAGSYDISASVSFATNATGRRLVLIYLNGTEVKREDTGVGGNSSTIGVSHKMYLASGDQVSIYVWQNSGVAINLYFHHDFQIVKL